MPTNNMYKRTLKKKSKSLLINLVLQQKKQMKLWLKKIKTWSKQIVKQPKNDKIILPQLEFRDDYKPVPLPRTKIEQVAKALKGYTKSFEISIKYDKDPLKQLQSTRTAIEKHIISTLTSMKGLKFVETVKITFKKLATDETIYKTAYFNSQTQNIINNTEIFKALELSQQQILNKIAKWVSEGSGWTIQSVDNHYLNIVQYQPMKGS